MADPEDRPPSVLDLPTELLQEVLRKCGAKWGVCFVCSCAALWAREARLLDLHDVSLTITRPAQAARLAPWVAARRDRIVRLAVAVAAQSDVEEAHDLEWGLRAVWAALEGAASLEGLSWDSAYLRGGSTDVVHSHSGWLGHKLCYAAPALPALRQLSLEADAVALCPSYARALPALTHLSLTGMAVQLPAGCLPRTLRMLRVSLQGEHAALSRGLVAQLPAAAEGSPGIQCFELAWNTRRVVPLAGLSALRALTALRLRSVRIEALPEDLARLSGLQELSLRETALLGGGLEPLAGLPNLTGLELLGVWGGADFAGARTLPQLQELCFIPVPPLRHAIPATGQPLLTIHLDLYQALANLPALCRMTALRTLSLPCRRLPLEPAAVTGLLATLAELPALRALSIGPLEDAGCWGQEVQAALVALGERVDVSLPRTFPIGLQWLEDSCGWDLM